MKIHSRVPFYKRLFVISIANLTYAHSSNMSQNYESAIKFQVRYFLFFIIFLSLTRSLARDGGGENFEL